MLRRWITGSFDFQLFTRKSKRMNIYATKRRRHLFSHQERAVHQIRLQYAHPPPPCHTTYPIPAPPTSYLPPLEVCPVRKPLFSCTWNTVLLPLQHLLERPTAFQALRRRTVVLAAAVSVTRSIICLCVWCAVRMILVQRIALSLLRSAWRLHETPQPTLL